MSEISPHIGDPYRIRTGDTFSSIAKRSGKTVIELQKLNKLGDPNKLKVGQTLYLSEQSSFAISALFLDALRHPIGNLPYQLRFDGQVVNGKTDQNGQAKRQTTKSARSTVEIRVQDAQGAWTSATQTASGYGHKLVTLVSNAVVFSGQTELHPPNAPVVPSVQPKLATSKPGPTIQAPLPKPASGTPSQNNPAVHTKTTKAAQGQSIIKIEVDFPQPLMELFMAYRGGEIEEKDWETLANRLECEAAVLKAIAKVESGGRSSFWRLNNGEGAHLPAIMYERHYFSRLAKGKYDQTHPDISWPTGYRKKSQLGSADKKMFGGQVRAEDIYKDYASSYLRLINAYQLDFEAALSSCSWGKFQVMGANYGLCGTDNSKKFVREMSTSEFAQIVLLGNFIQRKPAVWIDSKNRSLGKHPSLWDAVKIKDWKMIAFNYNGPGYRTYQYDTKMEAAYREYVG